MVRTLPSISRNSSQNFTGNSDLLLQRSSFSSLSAPGTSQQPQAVRPSSCTEETLELSGHRRSDGSLASGIYSSLFLVPKPDGTFRPIIDLKKLNIYLDIPSFKMETLFSIITALQSQEWITKIDLKDAYHHIPVHINIRRYFRFVIAGKPYQFRVLPFSLSTAPHEFTKTLAPVVQLLRSQ